MKKENTIDIRPVTTETVTITLKGETPLILNKMSDPTVRLLTDQRKNKSKKVEEPNEWEEIITSIHWKDKLPKDIVYNEETYNELLKTNQPCITAYGLKESWKQAVVRNEIDKYSTKFSSAVTMLGDGLFPVRFTEAFVDEKLMSPKKGSPVLVRLNRFTGWEADVKFSYIVGGACSLEQILQVIALAGFGLGIGSSRNVGYGRYSIDKATS
jgi:hypothetical protein